MAVVVGSNRSDLIGPGGISAGVSGQPGNGDDSISGSAGSDTVDGGAGTDILDYFGYTTPLSILFIAADAGTVTKPDGIDNFTRIERLRAGTANDSLTGPASSNGQVIWLRGNAGRDTIDGASNRDVAADYSNSPAAINVKLTPATGLAYGTAVDGWGSTDQLINVRRVIGSRFNDTIVGGEFGDVFVVTSIDGVKTLNGNGSRDRGNEIDYAVSGSLLIDLSGRSPSGGFNGSVVKPNGLVDILMNFTRAVAGSGDDTILGTWADDTLAGGAGNDVIIGRSGYNTVSYADTSTSGPATLGARIDLTLGTARDGWGNTDTLLDIQAAHGSALADELRGRDLGFATRAFIQGLQGDDLLRGGTGGFTAADYNDDPTGVDVDIAAGRARDGWGGTDTLLGINAARGSAFADRLAGSAQDDWLAGGAGHDTLLGGDGADRLSGEDGDDVLAGGAGNDVLTGGNGRDTMTGGAGADRFGFSLSSTRGAASSFTAPDVITDYSVAEGDQIRLSSSLGDVAWRGIAGFSLATLSIEIQLSAPIGAPVPSAWFIPATSAAGLGGWLVIDEDGDGTLELGETVIRLEAAVPGGQLNVNGPAVATIIGNSLDNVLFATGRGDGLRGLDGADVLYGSAGPDNLVGGSGNDTYVVRNFETVLLEDVAGGDYDVAWLCVSGAVISANIEEIRLVETANLVTGANSDETIVANATLASTIYARGGNDTLWGSGLADTLDGGDGDDIIRGQGGADRMFGGLGHDQYVVAGLDAVIIENINSGSDTAWVTVNNYTLAANIEYGRLSGPLATTLNGSDTAEELVANAEAGSVLHGNGGNDVLWGSRFADTLLGGAGNDVLRSQGGADSLVGGTGDDQYVVFAADAIVVEGAAGGRDIIFWAGSGTYTLGANIEEARLVELGTGLLGGDGAELLVGNSSGLASFIRGNGGDDLIWGTAGADTLLGGAGNDILYGQRGADIFRYDTPGWGIDQIGGFGPGAKLQFTAGSGVTAFGQLSLSVSGGNTQVGHANGQVTVFGTVLSATDFIFG